MIDYDVVDFKLWRESLFVSGVGDTEDHAALRLSPLYANMAKRGSKRCAM